MALIKTVNTDFGLEIQDAHHRVENVALIAKDKMSFQVRSRVHVENPIFDEKLHVCSYNINGENPIAQAYAYLKTLEQFIDAVDC